MQTDDLRYQDKQKSYFNGVWVQHKEARHAHYHYWRCHYFLPTSLNATLKQLHNYFNFIDTNSKAKFKYRYLPCELVDTTANLLFNFHNQFQNNSIKFIESNLISSKIWMIFGRQTHIPSKCFKDLSDLLDYYERIIPPSNNYNIFAGTRLKENLENDRLRFISEKYKRSINIVLASGLILLADFIRNIGPDCGMLPEIFTNDLEAKDSEKLLSIWKHAHSKFDQKKKITPPIITPTSTKQKEKYMDSFSDVFFYEEHGLYLNSGEVVFSFIPKKKNKQKIIDQQDANMASLITDPDWEDHIHWLQKQRDEGD